MRWPLRLEMFTILVLALILSFKFQTSFSVDLINTDDCGVSKGCLLKPDGCRSNAIETTCSYALTYVVSSGGLTDFEVQASGGDVNTGRWVAVGFSPEGKMDRTAVSACVWVPRQNRPKMILNHNYRYSTRRVANYLSMESQMLSFIEGGLTNGQLVCRFRQRSSTPAFDAEVYNISDPYYLIAASGFADASDANNIELRAHDMSRGSLPFPQVSQRPVDLRNIAVNSGSQGTVPEWVKPILRKVHGILMIFGWWLFVPTAIMFARYFKNMWPDAKICGIKLWFHFHRGLQLFAVLQIVTAFVCIIVSQNGLWIGDKPGSRTHAITGLTCFIVILFEPIFALFRCHPGTKWRPLFTWPHRLLGLTAFCIAWLSSLGTTIWWATDFESEGLHSRYFGDAPRGLMIFYFVVVCAVALALEIHITVTERLSFLRNKKSGDMQLHGINGPSAYNPSGAAAVQAEEYSPIWGLTRGIFLGFFVICAIGVTVALNSFIGVTNR